MARRLGSTRKGEEKRAPIHYSYDQPETGQLELSYWESNPMSSIARKRTSFSSTFLLHSVYSANSHRERERETARNKRDYRSLEAQ